LKNTSSKGNKYVVNQKLQHVDDISFRERFGRIRKLLARSFNFTFRYIDDVLSLNNSRLGDFVDRIYPVKLEIKDTTEYVVNQKLQHVDDISFRERFGRIRVFFYKIRSVPS
jgi:hypothetical protein